jgi:hypothetical protein
MCEMTRFRVTSHSYLCFFFCDNELHKDGWIDTTTDTMKGYFLPSSSDARALHIINEEFVGGGGSSSYMFTTVLSMMLHGALFITLADPLLDLSGMTDREPTDRSINISFQRPAPPEVVQQPEPKPRVTATPEPQPKPEPKPKVEPAPPRPEVTSRSSSRISALPGR